MNWNGDSDPTSVPVLTNALLNEWAKIPSETIQNLVESLQRSVEAVIAAKGDQLHINVLSLFETTKTQNTLSGPKPELREKEPGSLCIHKVNGLEVNSLKMDHCN